MTAGKWDAIVVGSGIGGLACAAALARTGHRALVLEQHQVAGGLTQTFSRDGYTWNVGVHYVGGMAPGEPHRAMLDWLTEGRIEMARMDGPYDVMHFPDGMSVPFAGPESALRDALLSRFPDSGDDIDGFFRALVAAERAAGVLFRQRSLPALMSRLYGAWNRKTTGEWCNSTTAGVLARLVRDPRLRAVLSAPWLEYACVPGRSSFAMHAMVMRSFLGGAYYPAGGGASFAQALTPVIESAGGSVRTGAPVAELVVASGRVTGVRLRGGEQIAAPHVISDAGARSTVVRLLPGEMWYSAWAEDLAALGPSLCHVGLYLGLEGDVRAAGAGPANQWFHENWNPESWVWAAPGEAGSTPPAMLVSFPSLKDPRHEPGARMRHTAEIVAVTAWEPFAMWEDSAHDHRPAGYEALKAVIERNLLDAFGRRFPGIVPMIRHHEVSTPLSTVAFTGARQGTMCGLETSPRRFMTRGLRPHTPVRGLYLAGQDVATPGVVGAMIGGMLAAAAIDPRVYPRLGW